MKYVKGNAKNGFPLAINAINSAPAVHAASVNKYAHYDVPIIFWYWFSFLRLK